MGANDNPLLTSCSSSGERDILLRLCTVKELFEFLGGLQIKMVLVLTAEFSGWWSWYWAFSFLSSPFWSSAICGNNFL